MSLLMEALKRAEENKQDAAKAAAGGTSALRLEPLADKPAPAAGAPTTLPDLADHLAALDADLAAIAIPPPRPTVPPPPPAAPAAPPAPAIDPGREAVRNAFAAKEALAAPSNSRRSLWLVLGVLGLGFVATGGWVWYQIHGLTPAAPPPATPPVRPSPVAALPAPRPAALPAPLEPVPATAAALPDARPAAPPAAPPLPSAVPSSAVPSSAVPSSAVPLPAVPPSAARPSVAPPSTMPAASATVTERTPTAPSATAPERPPVAPDLPARRAEAAEPAPGGPVRLVRSRLEVDPNLGRGYRSLQAGHIEAARADYELALRRDPKNIDALLGLAAIAQREGRSADAERYQQRAVEADPKDAAAQAATLGAVAAADPATAESRLKSLLSAQPESGPLNFALANLYSRQQRWSEAQQAYFNAVAADGDNPDYLFNLAVSLDHLRQPRLAAQHYRLALEAAERRAPAFDREQAKKRLQSLQP